MLERSGSRASSIPPPPEVITLLPLNENAAMSPSVPTGGPLGGAQRLGGVLDHRDAVRARAIAASVHVDRVAEEVDDDDASCAVIAALDRAVAARRSGSTSAKTGVAPR